MSGSPHIAAPAELRLFPLQSVLFPGATLPLQVFEERYRLLVAECIEEGAPFGVAVGVGPQNSDRPDLNLRRTARSLRAHGSRPSYESL